MRAEDRGASPRILSKRKKEGETVKIKDLATMAGNCRHMELVNTKDSQGNIVRQHLVLNGVAIFPLDGVIHIATFAPHGLWADYDYADEMRKVWHKIKELAAENEMRKNEKN